MPTHGIVAAVRVDDHRAPRLVDRVTVETHRRRRLHGDRHADVLPGRDPAEDAARVIGEEAFRRHLVRVLGAALRDRREARADFHALHGVDPHHRRREIGVELAVDGLAPAHRHAGRDDLDARAARVAGLAQPVHERLELGDDSRVRDEERIGVDVLPAFERNGVGPDLRQVAADRDAVALAQPLLRDRRRPRRARRSRARTAARRRGSRGCRTSASTCSRRGRDGTCPRCSRSPCCAGPRCGSGARSACPSCGPRTRRTGSRPCRTRGAASRAATCPDGGGRVRAGCRLPRAPCPGGQPSTTQPIAGPCDSPNDVTQNRVPNVLPDMGARDVERIDRV